jgi:hypothetical protein
MTSLVQNNITDHYMLVEGVRTHLFKLYGVILK